MTGSMSLVTFSTREMELLVPRLIAIAREEGAVLEESGTEEFGPESGPIRLFDEALGASLAISWLETPVGDWEIFFHSEEKNGLKLGPQLYFTTARPRPNSFGLYFRWGVPWDFIVEGTVPRNPEEWCDRVLRLVIRCLLKRRIDFIERHFWD